MEYNTHIQLVKLTYHSSHAVSLITAQLNIRSCLVWLPRPFASGTNRFKSGLEKPEIGRLINHL